MNEIIITDDKTKIDLSVVFDFISTESYWGSVENAGKGRSLETIKISIDNSMCFTVIDSKSNEMIGFARMITDKATYAYLADVFIRQDRRSNGIGKKLMTFILAHKDLQNLRRIMLATRDAHELYRKFGFNEVSGEDIKKIMQIKNY